MANPMMTDVVELMSRRLPSKHRDFDVVLFGEGDGFGIAGIRVARDADARIVSENALDARSHFLRAVSDRDLAGVNGVADADAAAIVNRNPARATGGVEHGVEHGPVGDRVGAVAHGFGLAIGRSDGAAIEMVAADDDGRLEFAACDEIVEREAEFFAFAITEPADARGQALKVNALLRHLDPARERFVVGEHFEDELVGAMNVRRFAGERGPAERPATFAKERTNVGRDEAGKIVGVLDALLESHGANVVAVVECDGAEFLQSKHAFDVNGHGFHRALAIGLGIALAKILGFVEREALRDVAADGVVSAGLIREQIGHDAAAREFRNDVGAIADEADGGGFAFANGILQDAECFVEIVDHDVAIACFDAALDAFGIDFDAEERAAGERRGERLRAAHSPHAAGGDEFAGEIAAEMLSPRGGESFVRALQNALRADVNPTAGGHLAVHHQAGALEFVELLPIVPVADEI